jgi:hypothetical protein
MSTLEFRIGKITIWLMPQYIITQDSPSGTMHGFYTADDNIGIHHAVITGDAPAGSNTTTNRSRATKFASREEALLAAGQWKKTIEAKFGPEEVKQPINVVEVE